MSSPDYQAINSGANDGAIINNDSSRLEDINDDDEEQERLYLSTDSSCPTSAELMSVTTNLPEVDNKIQLMSDSDSIGSPNSQTPLTTATTSRRKQIKSDINETLTKIKSINKEDLKLDTGKYIKSIVYGGMDGLVSIFVSVAVVATGQASIGLLLSIAFAKLVAGAISMGMGDYLGTQADVDFAKGERQRESWEVEYYPEGEKKEMVEIYVSKGIPLEIATEVVDILAKNQKGFVDIMMVEELGIMPDTENEVAWKNGLVNFVSFLIFGIIPMLPYFVLLIVAKTDGLNLEHGNNPTFYTVIALTVVTLFLMGVFQAKTTDSNWIKKGLITVILGVIGAFSGYITVEIVRLIDPTIDIN
ncbi:DUF125 family protein [Heterostelium album PN500]|uniref:DUF125 family protein n=1 Tax=Heterostelium pallidum (strain ATCC 26659 / Pp 5 / PN500) TaxID=670386 RepID=D3AW72_HETP5|nr:DUF125 family protein [Heterostelium album PN500]EFA86545.1 DUF125 family protein [Heterostelium album PN500]|eukprot:XP_020438650.1 DUF125 family protein [Heterostelium album PN500]